MPTEAVLFDLDGTLLDTAPDFIAALNTVAANEGQAKLDDSSIRNSVSDGARALVNLAFNCDEGDLHYDRLRQALLDSYLAIIGQNTVFFTGMDKVLEHLEENNIPWGIVTNKPWLYTEALLSNLALLERSSATVCPDHVVHKKPHPEALYAACSTIGCLPKNCIYVGDHLRDVDAGNNADMFTIAARYGYLKQKSEADEWKADAIIDQPLQLIEYLK